MGKGTWGSFPLSAPITCCPRPESASRLSRLQALRRVDTATLPMRGTVGPWPPLAMPSWPSSSTVLGGEWPVAWGGSDPSVLAQSTVVYRGAARVGGGGLFFAFADRLGPLTWTLALVSCENANLSTWASLVATERAPQSREKLIFLREVLRID